ncbi:MAG: serine/threonine-protein phosphatase [Clostridia bacterium]|nr:serine/threonine-protein phosphatase [Clostridia bacterium]
MNTLKFTSAVSVDKGLIRDNNEDNFYFNGAWLTAETRDNSDTFSSSASGGIQIYGVFDGMGGEELGEEASLITAQVMHKTHERLKSAGCDVKEAILSAVEDANVGICRKIKENGGKRIGATFSAIVIENNKATVFNIGDSRVYLHRAGVLEQISVDDTGAQRLVSIGVLTDEEAKTHKDRNKLTQHLGIFKEEMIIEPHISNPIDIHKNDKFLLCSDGLTDMVTDEEICRILSQDKPCEQLSAELVKTALENGGKDNVTAIVAKAGTKKKKFAWLIKRRK